MTAHVSIPTAGLYKMRLVKGGPWCPVRLWRGFGADPVTGEILERCWMWRAEINGRENDIDRAWPWCAGHRIPQSEYDYLLAVHGHAAKYAPHLPEARPREKIDLHRLPPVW